MTPSPLWAYTCNRHEIQSSAITLFKRTAQHLRFVSTNCINEPNFCPGRDLNPDPHGWRSSMLTTVGLLLVFYIRPTNLYWRKIATLYSVLSQDFGRKTPNSLHEKTGWCQCCTFLYERLHGAIRTRPPESDPVTDRVGKNLRIF